jgi:hypothetical protein
MYGDMTEQPDRFALLRERHAELLRAIEESGFDLDPPPLRNRNGFFNSLLHGEREELERTRLRWQEYKRAKKLADDIDAQLGAAIRQEVVREPGYRALEVKVAQEKRAKRACKRLIEAIRAAQRQVGQAHQRTPDAATRSVVRRDMANVSRRLDNVQRCAQELRQNLSDGRSFQPGELASLQLGVSRGDSHEKRRTHYSDLGVLLSSLKRTADALLTEISRRKKDAEARQRQYVRDGRIRYDRPSGGRA